MDEAGWYKSSYSSAHNGCVEVTFRRSSHSKNGFACVEVADGCGLVHVRDSKDPAGPMLSFSPADWQAFADSLKTT